MLYQQKHCLLGLKGVAAEQNGKAVGLPKLFKQDTATANICYPSRKSNNDSKDAAPGVVQRPMESQRQSIKT